MFLNVKLTPLIIFYYGEFFMSLEVVSASETVEVEERGILRPFLGGTAGCVIGTLGAAAILGTFAGLESLCNLVPDTDCDKYTHFDCSYDQNREACFAGVGISLGVIGLAFTIILPIAGAAIGGAAVCRYFKKEGGQKAEASLIKV